MSKNDVRSQASLAVAACNERKATDLAILELGPESSGLTDYFIICSGSNPRQIQAISDGVDERLSKAGVEPRHIEGYNQADWVLMDYVDFIVHIFSENARKFYDLERLWKTAKHLSPDDLSKPAKKVGRKVAASSRAVAKRAGSKTAAARRPAKRARAKKH